MEDHCRNKSCLHTQKYHLLKVWNDKRLSISINVRIALVLVRNENLHSLNVFSLQAFALSSFYLSIRYRTMNMQLEKLNSFASKIQNTFQQNSALREKEKLHRTKIPNCILHHQTSKTKYSISPNGLSRWFLREKKYNSKMISRLSAQKMGSKEENKSSHYIFCLAIS